MGFFASSGILNQRGFFSAPASAAPPAPSGIPVATQNLVINFGAGDSRNGTYISQGGIVWGNPEWSPYYVLAIPNAFGNGDPQTWTFWDADGFQPVDPSNPSTDPNFIPNSGWSPNITITAA